MLSLRELIHPTQIDAFVERYWSRDILVGRIDAEATIRELPEVLSNPENVFDVGDGQTQAWLVDKHDRHRQLRNISKHSARALYASGATIYVHGIESRDSATAQWLALVAQDLGVPSGALVCSAFMSVADAGARLHFDAPHSISIQLTGIKQWRLASNTFVQNPPEGHVLGETISSQLAALCPFGIAAPRVEEFTDVEMTPGSTLYVPCGTWHETKTVEESLHVSIAIASKSWAQLVADEVMRSLSQNSEWREMAVGRTTGSLFRNMCQRTVANLMPQLDDIAIELERVELGEIANASELDGSLEQR